MEIREFAEKVCTGTAEKLGPEYKVSVREMVKNNGVVLQGLVIEKQGERMVPVLHLEDLWEAYREGRSLEEIVNKVLDRYVDSLTMEPLEAEKFDDFEKIKGGICFRLFGRAGNEAFLKDLPYVEFLDMAVSFYYVDEADREGLNKLLTVSNGLMRRWGTDTEELLRLASENTPRIFPEEYLPIDQMIAKLMCPDLGGEEELSGSAFEGSPLQILRNMHRQYGAACLLYPGLLERIAEKEGSFYIIPSSVHETILIKDTGAASADRLKEMIYQVNREALEPEEVLTDSLYYYDAAEKKMKVL